MKYVIDRANINKEHGIERISLSINDNRIEYISPHMENVNFIKMDVSSYLLTPSHVMLDFKTENLREFTTFIERMKDHISKGCTTVLVCITIKYESELLTSYKRIRHLMINSPIDYCFAVRIPFRLLSPSFISQCKRLRIPVVFTDVMEGEMNKIAWAWIRESMYPYYLSIVPIWRQGYSPGKIKKITGEWKELLKDEGIPTIPVCPIEDVPLSINVLRKMGISPLKGEIRIGGEVDYNLYRRKSLEFANMEEVQYDMDKPLITVHNGKCIKVGERFYINPGYGKQICIKVPGFFASAF